MTRLLVRLRARLAALTTRQRVIGGGLVAVVVIAAAVIGGRRERPSDEGSNRSVGAERHAGVEFHHAAHDPPVAAARAETEAGHRPADRPRRRPPEQAPAAGAGGEDRQPRHAGRERAAPDRAQPGRHRVRRGRGGRHHPAWSRCSIPSAPTRSGRSVRPGPPMSISCLSCTRPSDRVVGWQRQRDRSDPPRGRDRRRCDVRLPRLLPRHEPPRPAQPVRPSVHPLGPQARRRAPAHRRCSRTGIGTGAPAPAHSVPGQGTVDHVGARRSERSGQLSMGSPGSRLGPNPARPS